MPLVQGRVEFGDNLLLPLSTYEGGQEFLSLDRVLCTSCERKRCSSEGEMLTIVRSAEARMWLSFRYEMKKDVFDGFPGGCVKAGLAFVAVQYSSSHSTGNPRSKLTPRCCHIYPDVCPGCTHSSTCIIHGRPRPELHIRSSATSTLWGGSVIRLVNHRRCRLTKRLASRVRPPLSVSCYIFSFCERRLLVQV